MSGQDAIPHAPAIVRYNHEAVEQIVQSVRDGTYCAVLGPRLSGKTVLLRYVQEMLTQSAGWPCIYVDLRALQALTLQGFFADLIRFIAGQLKEQGAFDLPLPQANMASSAVFRGFLEDAVAEL